ncbi:YhdP family phospholipid transporter [Cellvibrio sp. OA-2007]|uniref:YhdP family phospholipid transporter n=1 Tax=Cellvibrio sp. OA-2007 TaxID=529823 RepID=UPI000A06B370|nr:AsmA-like C-terminal region-containing protein [Cellvibrio sp. OA-2007]
MTRALRKLVKWSYFLVALTLILLAVVVQSGRSFSHLLGDYNHNIADYFSSKLNAQVAIGQIQADWDGLKPSLLVRDLSIKSKADEPIVALKQARLRLDMLESLVNLRLVWSNLSLSQVDMSFAQTADGFWQIPGLPKRTDANKPGVQLDALLDMLLLSTKIEFQRSHLSFQFASGKQMQLASPYLLLENAGDFHRLALQIDVDEQPRSVYLIMEGQGDPRDQASFRSKGYLQLNRFPTSEPIAATSAFLLNGVSKASVQSEGMIDANIWFESRVGQQGYDLVGRLGLQRLSLPLGERRLSLDNFATELTGYWLPSGEWRLGLQQINAAMNEQKITDVNIAAASTGFKKPLQISMDKLDLARLSNMLNSAGVLGDGKLQEVLTTLNLRGQVRNLQLTLPLQAPKDWLLRANLNQVAADAWHGVPALTGVDAYLQAGQKGGFVDIDTQQFTMHYSPTYSAPMAYDRAKGQVAWHLQPENNQIYVNSGQLEFQQGDEVARGYMWLSLPWQRNTGDIDLYLQIGARQLNAGLYQKYTPAVVPQSLLAWLEQSIGAKNSGIATQAGFVYRGTLNTPNPMARTFQLYLDIEQAELNYHPGWPALSHLDGRLLVSDLQVSASVTGAKLYTSQVNWAEVRVNPRAQGAGSLLQVDGDISGAASDGIRVLREGMLRQYLGGSMDSWFMLGEMKARLDLDIPIGTGEEKPEGAHQQVDVELNVPRFELQNLNLAVNDLTGHISYNSDTGVSSDTLHGQFFDQPIAAKLSTVKLDSYSKTLIELDGVVDAQQIAYWSKRPEALFLNGNLPYRARVELHHRPARLKNLVELSPEETPDAVQSAEAFTEQAFAEVTITSNLENVSVNLPAPYGKPAKGERPFEFKLWLQENQAQIDVRYNNDIQALLRTDRARNNNLLNANIALASDAKLSEQPQFLVSGFLPGIDLDAWKEVRARYKTYTERLTPAIAQALSSSQSAAIYEPEQDAPAGLVAGLPFRAELMLGQYELGSTLLENLNVVAVPVPLGWQLEVENSVVAGKLLVPDSPFIPLQVDLTRLSLTQSMLGQADQIAAVDGASEAAGETSAAPARPVEIIDPRKLPLANISIASLLMDDNNYGNWSLQLRPNEQGVVIDNIRGSIRGVTVSAVDEAQEGARLIWQNTPTGVQTRFIGNLSAADLGGVLRAWGKPDTIESETAHFSADLFWAGSPQDFNLVNLNGEMSIAIETGRFKREANAGDGILRLMSILNFDTLARRLRFDFSDLYKSGLAYDAIDGKVRFNQGTMVFEEPLIVRTPSSGMQMAGSIDLRNETLNTRLVATLPVAGNVTFYAALATGLPAAAGVYLISKLFKKQVDQATSVSYTIKGSWDEPKMRFNRLFESEKSLRDSVNEKQEEALPPDKPSANSTRKKQ